MTTYEISELANSMVTIFIVILIAVIILRIIAVIDSQLNAERKRRIQDDEKNVNNK